MAVAARILIHVQHLLGTGHLRRAAAIASALAAAGHDVEIASGGPPLPDLDTGGARLFQLPPMRAADPTFRSLIGESGSPVDTAWKGRRRDILLARCADFRPDVLITELFPFGRRQLEFELLPLLAAAEALRPRPLILCSLRDVLVAPRDDTKVAGAIERAQGYDRILVHGDPALIDLPSSYPAARVMGERLAYTGYIASPLGPEPPPGEGDGEIIVSTGGGAVGARLLEAALEARAIVETARPWRLLLGPDLPQDTRARLLARRIEGVVIEPARRDFPGLLRRCHVSVSQAGYNTVMDLLQAKARAVLVPFAAGGETEQPLRAAALAARGWAATVDEAGLDAVSLAAAITLAGSRARPDPGLLRRDGAAETTRLVGALIAERRAA
jgi:predicted glycosyltransferase